MYNGRIDPVEHVSHFNYDEDYHHERRNGSSSSKGLGNDAMSKALSQISRSPFTCKIEGGRLPWRFTQPTFTMYNGRIDPVEHDLKVGLPTEHDLRKSLTKELVRSVHRFMDRIDEYKRVEEDQQQGKRKGKVIPQERRDFRVDRDNNNRPRMDFAGKSRSTAPQVVNTVF
ncbi:uncharacterized protein LOC115960167 [Quercus lobata]|uniref:uncharacterized protein LOC115960167 n=1 Tax=Quercus lobata TaxID=97700 RepID=UPI001246EBE5|nr:uncharacterized protein LOC115960167 [Quercus lobata]